MKQLISYENSPPELSLVNGVSNVFTPDYADYIDQNIPTTLYSSSEVIGGAEVKFTVEVPDEVSDPHPIVYAHGYCGFNVAYDELRNATARNGKIAITYQPPRVQRYLGGLHPKHIKNPERLLSQAVWGTMRGTLKMSAEIGLESDEFDLSGHSMGGRSAVLAALQHPKNVNSVICNQAAGLSEDDILTLISRLPKFTSSELLPAMFKKSISAQSPLLVASQASHYIARNLYKTGAEGIAVGTCDIRPQVRRLGELGIKSACLVGKSDNLILADRVARFSGNVFDLFCVYANPEANHLAPQVMPLETAFTHAIVLNELNKPTSLKLIKAAA